MELEYLMWINFDMRHCHQAVKQIWNPFVSIDNRCIRQNLINIIFFRLNPFVKFTLQNSFLNTMLRTLLVQPFVEYIVGT